MDRRCALCESKVSPRESPAFLGFVIAHRYRCACGTRFEVATRFGEVLMLGIGLALPLFAALAPARKFGSSSDRLWILVFLLCQLGVILWMVARSRDNGRRHGVVRDEP